MNDVKNGLVVAADIGGTKADLGLFAVENGIPRALRQSTVPTSSYGSVSGIFDTFLLFDAPSITAACVAVAGRVRNGVVDAPNLPWPVTLAKLKNSLEIDRVTLVNDLYAAATGIPCLSGQNLVTINAGDPEETGTRALIAPGTGLGESIIARVDGVYHPIPSEGGHTDFGPQDETQIELLRYVRTALKDHVSAERICCGAGIKLVHDFLVETGRAASMERVFERMSREDPSAVITDEALSGGDCGCAAAADLYLRILGAEAGNLALKSLSTGGLYIGGGIAPKILPLILRGGFMEGFTTKGRMSHILESIPVHVITEPKTALYGAALIASGIP